MSVLQNSIGDFDVLRIDPPPQGPVPVVLMETAMGVAGHSYWLGGEKGEPAALRTIVDLGVPDNGTAIGVAMVLMREYQGIVGQRVPITYAGLEITDWEYQIVGVRQLDIQPTLLSVGGVSGTQANGALLIAEWLVIPELVATTEA